MGTYFDKKKLIDENDDIFISSFDKNLDPESLSGIINAKKEYKSAEENGDTAAMKKANNKANSIRKANGFYDGGDDGSEYNRIYKPYESKKTPEYKSGYSDEIKKIISLISDAGDFEYSLYDDPLYEVYRNLYLSLGDDAYERALSQNALRTGGAVSTSAQSAAMQAKNEYNSMLTAKVPELYELAYKKYRDNNSELYKRLETLTGLDSEDYSRYRDTIEDFNDDREYFYNADKDYLDRIYDMYTYDSNLEYNLAKDDAQNKRKDEEFAYEKERDSIQDEQWNREFEHEKSLDTEKTKTSRMNIASDIIKMLTAKTPLSKETVNNFLKALGF